MKYDRSDLRCVLIDSLADSGYEIVEQGTDVSDPFHWWIVARKGEYELRIEERARALTDS